jgi:hypothetical protein
MAWHAWPPCNHVKLVPNRGRRKKKKEKMMMMMITSVQPLVWLWYLPTYRSLRIVSGVLLEYTYNMTELHEDIVPEIW